MVCSANKDVHHVARHMKRVVQRLRDSNVKEVTGFRCETTHQDKDCPAKGNTCRKCDKLNKFNHFQEKNVQMKKYGERNKPWVGLIKWWSFCMHGKVAFSYFLTWLRNGLTPNWQNVRPYKFQDRYWFTISLDTTSNVQETWFQRPLDTLWWKVIFVN
jgi:hypothetical protein